MKNSFLSTVFLPPVKFKNPSGYIVKEIPVMRNCDYSSLILLKVGLKPLYALSIKVVGRLIEQQHIRLPEQETA